MQNTYSNMPFITVDKEGCSISLCVLSRLNSTILTIDIVTGQRYNPCDGVIHLHKKWKTILSFAPNFKQRSKSIWNWTSWWKSVTTKRWKSCLSENSIQIMSTNGNDWRPYAFKRALTLSKPLSALAGEGARTPDPRPLAADIAAAPVFVKKSLRESLSDTILDVWRFCRLLSMSRALKAEAEPSTANATTPKVFIVRFHKRKTMDTSISRFRCDSFDNPAQVDNKTATRRWRWCPRKITYVVFNLWLLRLTFCNYFSLLFWVILYGFVCCALYIGCRQRMRLSVYCFYSIYRRRNDWGEMNPAPDPNSVFTQVTIRDYWCRECVHRTS